MLREVRGDMRPRAAVALLALAAAAAAAPSPPNLVGQEATGELVARGELSVPDSVPLTRVEQLVVGPQGSAFLLDAHTPAVLVFDSAGSFQRKIGRRGRGPGEFITPWRLGLIGENTLWVVDVGQDRVGLFDVRDGTPRVQVGSSAWTTTAAGERPATPFALLADRSILALAPSSDETRVELLKLPWPGRADASDATSLGMLSTEDRMLSVPVPAGGSGLRMRNPYSHANMLSVGPRGRRVVVVRRAEPLSGAGEFVVEVTDVGAGVVRELGVPYRPVPLRQEDVEAWASGLDAVEKMTELGVFPSRAGGTAAVLEALAAPKYYPPVRNRGRGITEDAVLVASTGEVWLETFEDSRQAKVWRVVSPDGSVRTVLAPPDARLLAADGGRVWGEVRDRLGVPTIRWYEVRWVAR